MAGTAVLGRLSWRLGEILEIRQETPRAKTLAFSVPGWPGHLPGQHVDVRLTAEDGYRAERSYSIASAPDGDRVELTIERLDDGEVSPYLTEDVGVGDRVELKGPIGGYFTWKSSSPCPLYLVGGGSGVVPLMAMIRHRAATTSGTPARLLYSSRGFDDIIYRDELDRLSARDDGFEVFYTLTRGAPDGWNGFGRRINETMLSQTGWPVEEQPSVFVCGPTALVESVASTLVALGHDPSRVKTERFGPTGG